MAETLDTLAVKITTDLSELRKGMNDAKALLGGLKTSTAGINKTVSGFKSMFDGLKNSVKSSADKINGSFKTVAKTAAAAFGAHQLTQFGKQCIGAASDLQEVQNVVDTVFGSMSSSVDEWAANAKKQFGLSELSAKKFSSTMGAMLKSSGISGNDMKTMSLNLSALAADMASFYNLSSSAAFDKIRAGISGETEPLKQLGINMSVANMEAYALSQGITKSYTAMSQAEQAILRYNYLMSVTKDAQGDFARTSNSWANQTKIFAETINQLKSNIGALLMQAFTPFLQMLNKIASKLVEVSGAIKNVFGLKSSSEQASDGLSSAADNAADVAGGLNDANKEAQKLKTAVAGFDELNILPPNTESLSDAGGGNANMDISNPYAGAFDGVAKNIGEIDQKTQAMLDKVIDKLRPVAEAVKLVKDTWTSAWENGNGERIIGNIKEYLNATLDVIHNIGTAFKAAWNTDNTGMDFINKIQNGLANIIGLAASVKQSIADAFATNSGVELIQALIGYFGMLIDCVSAFAEGLRAAWDNAGAGTELIQSIMDGFSAVLEVITSIGETIAETFRNEHGQAMFSSLIELGKTFWGIVKSIADAFREAWAENQLGQQILNTIADIVTNICGGVKTLGENFRTAWESNEVGKEIIQTLLSVIQNIVDKVKEMTAAFSSWAQGVDFEPLLNSVLALCEAFSNLVSVIMDKLSEAFSGTLLPLAEWTIEEGLPELINAFANALNAVAEVLSKIPPEILIAIAAGFAAIKLAVSGLGAAFGALEKIAGIITMITTLQGALSGLSGAAGAAGAGLASTGTAAAGAGGAAVGASAGLSSFGGILGTVGTAVAGISSAVLLAIPLIDDFGGSWNRITSLIKEGLDALKEIPVGIKSAFSGNLIDTTMFDALKAKIENLSTESSENFSNMSKDAKTSFDEMETAGNDAAQSIGDTFGSIFDKILMKISNIVSAIQDINGANTTMDSWVSSNSASAFSLSAPELPELAGGGVVRKATAVIAGEYPGASTNPEIVAPQKTLEKIINSANSSMAAAIVSGISEIMGGRDDSMELTASISGDDLLFAVKNAQRRKGYTISDNFGFNGI